MDLTNYTGYERSYKNIYLNHGFPVNKLDEILDGLLGRKIPKGSNKNYIFKKEKCRKPS